MSSKSISESKKDTKLIRCKNCRQDISSDKMFLHEGFCHRNNVFCEHCEKVFLKTDYEQHIKDLPKNLTSKETEPATDITDSKKSTSKEEESPIIEQTITTIVPNPTLEIVQMPAVEEISINAPIIISEIGQIVSNQNKNDYLLPFLGININDSNSLIEEKMMNIERHSTYSNRQYKNNDSNFATFQVFQPIKRDNTKYKFNTYDKKCNFKMFNDIDTEMINNNNDIFNYDNKNIVINNKIVTYNTNKNITKVNNFYTPEKTLFSEKKSDSPQDKPLTRTLNNESLSKSPKNSPKKNKNYNISNTSNERVPTDNKSKLLTELNKNLRKNCKEKYRKLYVTNKKAKILKVCGYCHKTIKDLNQHFKKCKYKEINDKNMTEEKELGDSLLFRDVDEFGIEDKNKKILLREFFPSICEISTNFKDISPKRKTFIENNEKKLLIKTQERNYRQIYINKNENSRSTERIKNNNIFNNYRNSPQGFTFRKEFKRPRLSMYNYYLNTNDIENNNDRKIFLRI